MVKWRILLEKAASASRFGGGGGLKKFSLREGNWTNLHFTRNSKASSDQCNCGLSSIQILHSERPLIVSAAVKQQLASLL
jgi:hypothetical protein